MHEGKQNDLGNFAKLLKKLQMDNLALPELRQLKQEHAYLEKLKQQRTKIEQLKYKYDASQAKLQSYIQQNSAQKFLIEQQHKTIRILEEKVCELQKKKNQYESGVLKNYEMQREKQKIKIISLNQELEELRKQCKLKDLQIFQIEDGMQNKLNQVKEQYLFQRKRVMAQYEEKSKKLQIENSYRQQETQQLKQLVTRQHKALQLQNQQYEQLSIKNEELREAISELQEQCSQMSYEKSEREQRMCDLDEMVKELSKELQFTRSGANAKEQIEQLRKKVGEMAKGQIQKIQFIVSEFE